MNLWRFRIGLVAIAVIALSARLALANSLSPYVYFWPGIIWIAFEYAFPASVLAALLERPFYTKSGVTQSALWYSLQANFVSTIVGILLLPIGLPALYAVGPLWSVAAFGISCLVEFAYLSWKTNKRLAMRWVIAGNAISSLVLVVLPPLAVVLREKYYDAVTTLDPYRGEMLLSATIASVILFLASFVVPRFAARRESLAAEPSISDQENTLPAEPQEVLSGEIKS